MHYKNLKSELAKYKIKQSELVETLNINQTRVSYKLNNKAPWRLEEIKKILDLLNNKYKAKVTFEYLFKE